MNCNIIRDLLPLYIDDCCSEDTRNEVKQHLEDCAACKRLFEDMSSGSMLESAAPSQPVELKRVNDWKASILQSALLFISFAIITLGVALESQTPTGFFNGFWAVSIVIPATGFMLSLANWYFVRLYRSAKSFSKYSCLLTLLLTICAFLWAALHYEYSIITTAVLTAFGPGFVLAAIFCVLSKLLSAKYAKMLGKE